MQGASEAECNIWRQMLERCYNPASVSYPHYGARGITVCDRWRASLAAFRADMGPRPSPAHSVDRIDNNGPYDPANCRWATREEQNNNRTSSYYLTAWGRTQTVTQWARETSLSVATLKARLHAGRLPEEALSMPVGGFRFASHRRPVRRPPPQREPATHCRNGHAYTPANTAYTAAGARRCRTCHNARVRQWYARRRLFTIVPLSAWDALAP